MELPGVAASVGWLAGPVRVSPAKPSTASATGGGIAIGDGTSSATATSPGAGVSHNGFYSGAVAGAGAGAGATAGGGSSDLPDSLELSGSSDAFHAVLPTRLDGIADALRGVRLTPVLVGMLHLCGASSLPWLTPPIADPESQKPVQLHGWFHVAGTTITCRNTRPADVGRHAAKRQRVGPSEDDPSMPIQLYLGAVYE